MASGFVTFESPVPPSVGAKEKPTVKILKADFGDGYTQIARDGVNNIRQNLELSWDVLTAAQADQIIGFFEQQGGADPFWFAMPGKAALKWTCAEWEETYASNGIHSVTAKFEQSFALA